MMKSLIICADDFAQSDDIDQGILQLIHMGRVTATSCLTLSPRWKEAAKNISQDIRAKADIGLHLDFTHFNQTLKNSLTSLIVKSYARLLPIAQVKMAIQQQLDHFENALGSAPDYVDGHQHVHQLPQIREALLTVLNDRYGTNMPWLRIAKPPMCDGVKAMVIGQLGANALQQQLDVLGARYTAQLLGVYHARYDANQYQQRLNVWLQSVEDDQPAALMCHPGVKPNNTASNDPFFSDRESELQVLASNAFGNSLKAHQIQLVRGSALVS